eukprot:1159965-Pelagomonas_calceolata.AAC.19
MQARATAYHSASQARQIQARTRAISSCLPMSNALEKMFERDWQRVCTKEKFTSMLAREHKVG